jgi:hypothetical protein
MLIQATDFYLGKAQHKLYALENNFAKDHPVLGRVTAIPTAAVDVILQTLKVPLAVIENIALTVINLVGALFSNKFSVKEAIFCLESAGTALLRLAVVIPLAPVKLIYQLFETIIDPVNTKSITMMPDRRELPIFYSFYTPGK